MPVYHLNFETVSRRALCLRGPRTLILAVARVLRGRLLLFGLAADHGHLVVRVRHARDLRALKSAVARALTPLTGPLAPFYVEEADAADHVGRLIGYGPRQCWKHHLPDDPLLYLGSHLPDVLGARVLPGFDPGAIAEELPGVDI